MDKFIPFAKLSKRKQRELAVARRGDWRGVNPVTRRPENPKAYDRKKARKWSEDSGTALFAFPGRELVPPAALLTLPAGRCYALIGKGALAVAIVDVMRRRRLAIAYPDRLPCRM